jgi:hypothetical protein
MIGVEVWLRTKKRSLGMAYGSPAAASQRISAFEPRMSNWSGGSGLTIGLVDTAWRTRAAWAGAGAKARLRPAASGTPAPASCSRRRLEIRRSRAISHFSRSWRWPNPSKLVDN